MTLNFTKANERFQLTQPTNHNQTLNLTTQNFTINNNDTSFANEQSYCLPKIHNTLNNSICVDEMTYPNVEQSYQQSYQPSVVPSINPTHRKFIFQNNHQKIKNTSTNRLLNWNEDYLEMTQSNEENRRFYFIKILNPFPQDIIELDKKDDNEDQYQGDDEEEEKKIHHETIQLENVPDHYGQNNKGMTQNDNPQEGGKQLLNSVEDNKVSDNTINNQNNNISDIFQNTGHQKSSKQIKVLGRVDDDNDEEEKKSEIQIQQVGLLEKVQEGKIRDNNLNKNDQPKQQQQQQQKNLTNQIKVMKQGDMQNVLESDGLKGKQINSDQQKKDKQKRLSSIFKSSVFQRFTGDSPCQNSTVNTIEKNKSQQREMREILREFLSYSDLIPIELKATQKWKVSRLKRFLFSTELSGCKFAKLLYQGKELKDLDMIYDYRISPGHIVQAVVQKEEILNQFYSNSERRRLGLNQVFGPCNNQNAANNAQGSNGQSRQQSNDNGQSPLQAYNPQQLIRPSAQIQQQLIREHQQRNIFNFINQQGFDKLKEQQNISDRDIILQRIYFHGKAQLSRDNYENVSDLLIREEKWLYSNFRKVDSYLKFRNYDFKKEQNFPYTQTFLRNIHNSNQEPSGVHNENEQQKQKLSTHIIQFICGILLGYILGLFLFILLYFRLEVCTISRTFIYSILVGILAKSFYLSYQFVLYDQIDIFV